MLKEDDYTDGPKLFINNLDIPVNIEGKDFFGLFETSAGASGGGGYSIILVNIDTNEHTIINQDASVTFQYIKKIMRLKHLLITDMTERLDGMVSFLMR